MCGVDVISAREVDEVATHSNTFGGGVVEGGIEFDLNSLDGEQDPVLKNSKQHTTFTITSIIQILPKN